MRYQCCIDCSNLNKKVKQVSDKSYRYSCKTNSFTCGWMKKDNEMKNFGCSDWCERGLIKQKLIYRESEEYHMDDLEFLGESEIPVGIPLNDKYRIETSDVLNVLVKEKYTPKPKEDGGVVEDQWKTISYHPSLEMAFRSIVDREINLTAGAGLEAVIKKIEDLKLFKKKIQ